MAGRKKSNELKLSRVYDAPVKLVWEAWTDPAQVAKWWGPRGFTLTTHGKDLRPGGFWRYTMHGPDGVDYPNHTVYHEVEKERRLVYDHGGYDDRPPLFRVTVTFEERKGKTHMEMTMTLPTPEAAEETRGFIKKAGGNSTWDRLGEYLAKEQAGKEQFIINRSFDAPVETLFEMWTQAEHFTRWLAPIGLDMRILEGEIRAGKSVFFVMSDGQAFKLYGKLNYLVIDRPDRIVYTQSFCDEKGNLARHPAVPTWPMMMMTTVLLTAEGPDSARATVIWEVHGSPTAEELQTFIAERSGMTQGWTGSFDKLEALLAGQG